MCEGGCEWFQWAYDGLDQPTTPMKSSWSPPSKRQRSPSIEVLSPLPTSSMHHHKSPSQRSLKRHKHWTSPDRPSSLPACHCHSSSAEGNLVQHSPTARSSWPLDIAHCHASSAAQSHTCVWPSDFYVDEMDAGFTKCALESNRQRLVEEVFQSHFHAKFIKSTFYNHCRHWMSVKEHVQRCYIGYGHTERGHWSTFLRQEIKGEQLIG